MKKIGKIYNWALNFPTWTRQFNGDESELFHNLHIVGLLCHSTWPEISRNNFEILFYCVSQIEWFGTKNTSFCSESTELCGFVHCLFTIFLDFHAYFDTYKRGLIPWISSHDTLIEWVFVGISIWHAYSQNNPRQVTKERIKMKQSVQFELCKLFILIHYFVVVVISLVNLLIR